jgi:hypothetical protein
MELDKLVEQFAQHVQAETEAGWRGDAQTANRHVDEYLSVFDKIRAQGNIGRDALAALFKHPRMDVRVTAAVFLLRHRTADAGSLEAVGGRYLGLGPGVSAACNPGLGVGDSRPPAVERIIWPSPVKNRHQAVSLRPATGEE